MFGNWQGRRGGVGGSIAGAILAWYWTFVVLKVCIMEHSVTSLLSKGMKL